MRETLLPEPQETQLGPKPRRLGTDFAASTTREPEKSDKIQKVAHLSRRDPLSDLQQINKSSCVVNITIRQT